LAVAVDAFRGDSDGASATTGAREPRANIGRCERGQLRLVIEILGGTPAAALQHVRGRLCETENLPISVMISGGRGRVLGPRGAFGGLFSPNSQRVAEFRYSPACDERGPFVAVVRAGPYLAQARIPALRCGL
jgi:hypothetical protein